MKAIDIKNACLGAVSSRADHSVRFSVETPELTPEFSAHLISLHGASCRILIEPDEADGDMVEVLTERSVKTPSQRIRSRLYALWAKAREQGKTSEVFDVFYLRETEKYLQAISERIDAL